MKLSEVKIGAQPQRAQRAHNVNYIGDEEIPQSKGLPAMKKFIMDLTKIVPGKISRVGEYAYQTELPDGDRFVFDIDQPFTSDRVLRLYATWYIPGPRTGMKDPDQVDEIYKLMTKHGSDPVNWSADGEWDDKGQHRRYLASIIIYNKDDEPK